ncbi:hypothetical protein M0802_014179 [Mischocyttarus mexicanus]|nr:hypothetical protein M0802_014318 [Mischocyttarus mexicanus]KAI4480488.1 hypothetical protein M0802_014179 [Mischocyttarus mexicanus]
MDFVGMLNLLWCNYVSGQSFEDVAEICLSNQYFLFPDVCFATIEYWYERFATDFSYFNFNTIIDFVNIILRMEYLMTVKSKHPLWTINHYMDALKISEDTAKWYLHNLMIRRPGQ